MAERKHGHIRWPYSQRGPWYSSPSITIKRQSPPTTDHRARTVHLSTPLAHPCRRHLSMRDTLHQRVISTHLPGHISQKTNLIGATVECRAAWWCEDLIRTNTLPGCVCGASWQQQWRTLDDNGHTGRPLQTIGVKQKEVKGEQTGRTNICVEMMSPPLETRTTRGHWRGDYTPPTQTKPTYTFIHHHGWGLSGLFVLILWQLHVLYGWYIVVSVTVHASFFIIRTSKFWP